MQKLIRDPELDQLVRQLNQSDAVAPPAETDEPLREERLVAAGPALPPPALPDGSPLEKLLIEMAQKNASDLLILAGAPPVFRIGGRLVPSETAPYDASEVQSLLGGFLNARMRERMEEDGGVDFSLRLGPQGDRGWRFRVNVHRQRGTLAAAVRLLPSEIPTLSQLNLPLTLAELVKPTRGLVLVCGPTGSGKSSTLAALVAEINRTRTSHILTIEDPIEYEHRSQRSVVEHVEVGRDTRSFDEALRAAMRQDPDVILVGEMRDLETVATALTAAETGHLVLSTLHTNDAQQAVHRIVDVFPPAQQSQIRHQLALSLHAIVVQQLVPRVDGKGRVPAIELLLATYAVRHHIRSDNLQKLYNELVLAKRLGMISLESSLAQLVQRGLIDIEEARVRASHPDELELLLRT
jgi:twitching motility protein PilT